VLGGRNRNRRLAAVRRLAYEAADSGFLSTELAAGIRRVQGVKQLGGRTRNLLTQDQARLLLQRQMGTICAVFVIGTDSVPSWSCLGVDNRVIPWLQAKTWRSLSMMAWLPLHSEVRGVYGKPCHHSLTIERMEWIPWLP
jgi:hypothetical protein